MNNLELVKHCEMALQQRWGYVWGTFGQRCSENVLDQKLNQYSNVRRFESFIRSNWMNRRVADCVGLIKSALWWKGNRVVYDIKTDLNANHMFNSCTETGSIENIPEIPGLLVYKRGHIGVYVGGGYVIEARSTKKGVIRSKLSDLNWDKWGKCHAIDYIYNDYDDRWSESFIELMKENSIMAGFPDGSFRPEETITREQIAVVISNLMDHEEKKRDELRLEFKNDLMNLAQLIRKDK